MKTRRKVASVSKSECDISNQDLQSEETIINMYFNMVPDLFCVFSVDRCFHKLNHEWEIVTRFTIAELCQHPLTEFIHPDDVEGTIKAFDDLHDEMEYNSFFNRFRCKDNSYKWLEWRVKISKDKPEFYAVARDMTERYGKEQMIHESKEKYEAAFNTSPDANSISNMDGTYVDVNAGFTELTGYSKDDVIGRSVLDIGIWANLLDRDHVIDSLQEYKSLRNFESVFRTKDGSLKTVLISASIVNINNEPHILSVSRDITSRKLTEKTLNHSENRFRQIAENSEDMIWEVDTEGMCTYCNEIVSSILGYKPEEVVGKMHFYDFFEPGLREELKKEALIRINRKEKIKNFINYNIHKDGHTVILETNGSPILTKHGVLIGYRGTNTDITKRILAENALRESEKKYRLLAENSADVIWTINLQGEVTYINTSVEKSRGFIPEEVMHHGIDDIMTPASAVIVKQFIGESIELIKTGKSFVNKTLILEPYSKDGSKVCFEVKISPLFDDNKQFAGFVGISRDISERKKAEQTLIEAKEELQNSEQLFRSLAEYSPNMILIILNNKIHYVNHLCEERLGFTKEELYSPDFDIGRLSAPEHLEVFRKNFLLTTTGKEVEPFEFLMADKDGTVLYTMVNLQPIHIGEEHAILGVIVDISELKWAEYILKQKANQVEYINNIMVERELKLVDLKKEVNSLLERFGEEPKYTLYD